MSLLSSDLSVAQVTGPVLLSYITVWILYGFVCSSTYTYSYTYQKDPLRVKLLVYFLLCLSTAQAIMMIHDAFDIFGTHFGDISVLNAHLAWFDVILVAAFARLSVQLFYVHRILALSKAKSAKIVSTLIVIFSVVQLAASIVTAISVFKGQWKPPTIYDISSICSLVWLILITACDILISTFLIYLLVKSDAEFRKSKSLVSKLIRITIETGFVTAVLSIVDLSIFLACPPTYHIVVCSSFANMYAIMFLVILNNRSRLRSTNGEGDVISGNISYLVFALEDSNPIQTASVQPSKHTVSVGMSPEGTKLSDINSDVVGEIDLGSEKPSLEEYMV